MTFTCPATFNSIPEPWLSHKAFLPFKLFPLKSHVRCLRLLSQKSIQPIFCMYYRFVGNRYLIILRWTIKTKKRKKFRAGWSIKKSLSFFFIVIERKIEIHPAIKKFSFHRKREKEIDEMDRKGKKFCFANDKRKSQWLRENW